MLKNNVTESKSTVTGSNKTTKTVKPIKPEVTTPENIVPPDKKPSTKSLRGIKLKSFDITQYCNIRALQLYTVNAEIVSGLIVKSANGETSLASGVFKVRNLLVKLNEIVKIDKEYPYLIVALSYNGRITIRGSEDKRPHWFQSTTMITIKAQS